MRLLRVLRTVAYVVLALVVALGAVLLYFAMEEPSSSLPKNLIVLLEDPDGKVGEVAVTGGGVEEVLNQPRQATGTSSASEPLVPPFTVTESEIAAIFGDVVAARPAVPVKFSLVFEAGVGILASAGETIDSIVSQVRQRPLARVSIYGYASGQGNVVLNRGSALFRARAVREALVSRGLDGSEFLITTLVDPGAVITAPDGTVRPDNRRVEVVVR